MHTNILTMIYVYIYIYIYKFILSLKKGVYPYEHIDDRKEFSEASLSKKEHFYSHPNMKDINDED